MVSKPNPDSGNRRSRSRGQPKPTAEAICCRPAPTGTGRSKLRTTSTSIFGDTRPATSNSSTPSRRPSSYTGAHTEWSMPIRSHLARWVIAIVCPTMCRRPAGPGPSGGGCLAGDMLVGEGAPIDPFVGRGLSASHPPRPGSLRTLQSGATPSSRDLPFRAYDRRPTGRPAAKWYMLLSAR